MANMEQARSRGTADPQTAKFDPAGIAGRAAAWPFEQMDRIRRLQGLLLDRAGLGPAQTPFRILHKQPGLRVRAYGTSA